jgi:glycosyltransferase involved in cell wall biosynthesis
MRVAYDARALSINKAGIGYYTNDILKYIIANDPTINLFLISNKEIIFEKNKGVALIETSGLLWKFNSNVWFQLKLPLIMKKNKIDLFHGTMAVLPMLSDVPSVVTIYDLVLEILPGSMHWKNWLPLKILMKASADKSTRIIAISENTKKDIMKFFGIEQEKIKVIYPGISNNFCPCKMENDRLILNNFNLSPGYILTVGTLEPRKNINRLLNAYKMLVSGEENIPQLVIVGGQGWLSQDINELVDTLGLREKVIFTGYVPDSDLPALYRGAEMLIYPSLYEGFGFPPLEAMACGIPVISSNISSIPEVVGDAGILVDPYSPDDMARAIAEVLRNEELRTHLKSAGITRSVLFSWDKTAQETVKLYHEVVEENSMKKKSNQQSC